MEAPGYPGQGPRTSSEVWGSLLLPAVPKEVGVAEEQTEAKKALISTFLQG